MKTVHFQLDESSVPKAPAGRVNARKLADTSEAEIAMQQQVDDASAALARARRKLADDSARHRHLQIRHQSPAPCIFRFAEEPIGRRHRFLAFQAGHRSVSLSCPV